MSALTADISKEECVFLSPIPSSTQIHTPLWVFQKRHTCLMRWLCGDVDPASALCFIVENWPDALRCSAAWHDVWLVPLCADWHGCGPLPSKIDSARILNCPKLKQLGIFPVASKLKVLKCASYEVGTWALPSLQMARMENSNVRDVFFYF